MSRRLWKKISAPAAAVHSPDHLRSTPKLVQLEDRLTPVAFITSLLLSYDSPTSALTLMTASANPSADTVSITEFRSPVAFNVVRLRISLGAATFDAGSSADSHLAYSSGNPDTSTFVDVDVSGSAALTTFTVNPGVGADTVSVDVPNLALGKFTVIEDTTAASSLTVIQANANGFDGTARTISVTGQLSSFGGSDGVSLTAIGGGLSVVGGSVFSGSNAIALSGDGRATGTDGVRLSEANLSTFGPGGIRITGTGGAGATGVSVGDGSQVTTAERGDIVIDGTGGAAGNGVFIGGTRIGPNMTTDSSTVRASGRTFAGGSPAIIITGTASAGASDIAVQDSGVVGSMFGAGPVSFIADSVNIGTGVATAAGTVLASTFGVRTRTAGRAIDLGGTDSATALGLTSAELNRVTASRIDIGTRTGGITVSSDIVGPADTSFALGADGDTGNIKFLGGFTLTPGRTAPTLTLKAPGGGLIQPLRSGADITGATTLAPSSTLAVDINGTVPNTGYSRLVVAGTLGVADALLKLTGTYAPVVGDTFAIVSSSALTGTFRNLAQDATLIFNGRTLRVNYTATGVVLTVLDTTVVPPPPAPVHLSAVSFGPHVIAYDEDGSVRFTLSEPYAGYLLGSITVAVGDVTGDGIDDVVTGAGPESSGGHVKVFDGRDGREITRLSFFAYPGFLGGVNVAVGDITGDGKADIITGAGPGAGPHVRVFNPATLETDDHGNVTRGELLSFFAYGQAFDGGVTVAAGDVLGKGYAQIITGAGPGAGPHVRVFDPATLTTDDLGNVLDGEIQSFYAFDIKFTGGVSVAGGGAGAPGDNGRIFVGAGKDRDPPANADESGHVREFAFDGVVRPDFVPYVGFHDAVRVALNRRSVGSRTFRTLETGGLTDFRVFDRDAPSHPELLPRPPIVGVAVGDLVYVG